MVTDFLLEMFGHSRFPRSRQLPSRVTAHPSAALALVFGKLNMTEPFEAAQSLSGFVVFEFIPSCFPDFLRDNVVFLMKTFRSFVATVALSCTFAFAESKPADEQLRTIYNDEWKWRLEQFPG